MVMKIFLRSIILFFLVNTALPAGSQDFMPFIHDNYAGVTGMFYNPSSIVDSRYRFDMEFVGASDRIDNNWVLIDRSVLFNWATWKEDDFKKNHMDMVIDGHNKSAFMGAEARLLSFMANLDQKNAIGFSVRGRAIINFDNIPENAAILMFNNNNVDSLLTHHVFEDMSQEATAFFEYGLTYARVFLDNESDHFLKAGLTAKLLQGTGSLYLYEDYMEYDLIDPDTATKVNVDVKFGLTGNLEDIMKYQFGAKPGLGIDFGITYEWRPNHKDYKYDMDGKTNLWRRDQNKYKLRVAASILDVGHMSFQKQYNSGNFHIDTTIVDLSRLHADNLVNLADSINKYYGTEDKNSYFKMKLPTTLNIDIDYKIANHFYVNLAGRYAFNRGFKHYEKMHYLNMVSLAPRYERRWWGVSVPMRINQFGFFSLGLGLRMGPLWIGSSDLIGVLGIKSQVMGGDIHVALKVPILYPRPQDDDNDAVSNKYDECLTAKGSWAMRGCPDRDNDSIADKDDACPDVAGLAKYNGCPDTDNDGIIDKLDSCVTDPGLAKFHGCPDSDDDGVIDKLDTCPSIAGLAVFNGCPDMDGDSIPDYLDDCPEVAGLQKFNGCPDTDGDGIRDALDLCPTIPGLDSLQGCPYVDTDGDSIQDKYDQCPKIAGPRENGGCPYADTDNDSVPDKDDLCPMTPGPVSNDGCPVIKQEVQQILDTAFANLEFRFGKSIIKPSSYHSLDRVADLMIEHPEFNLLIEGHTDSIGRDAANMSLSQNRALAVKNYLISRGVKAERLTAKWYGETRPIAPNSTAEGRQKNRRVEMKIVFD
jgi:outer membrane protein OmpA-like peptidoglycan-associated protein